MKKIMMLLFMIALYQDGFSAEFFEPLRVEDVVGQVIFTGFAMIDWKQTRDRPIECDGSRCGIREHNSYIGDYTTKENIDRSIAAAIVGHWFITYAIPEDYRFIWQSITILPEIFAVTWNFEQSF